MNCLGTPHFGAVIANPETIGQVISPFDSQRDAYVGYHEVIADIDAQEASVHNIFELQVRPTPGTALIIDACRLRKEDLRTRALQFPHRQAELLVATVLDKRIRKEHAEAAKTLLAHTPDNPYPSHIVRWLSAISLRQTPDLYN
ncbi:MAG: hypothetical protein WBO35_02150 [Candidatus Saccharimonadales bacterium]